MTKAQAIELKKTINKGRKYTTYFSNKNGTMSVRVYTYINNFYEADKEAQAINELLSIVPGKAYEIKRRTYQGFIHDTDIIFK